MLVDDDATHPLNPRRDPDGERGGEDKRPRLRASLIPDAVVGGRDLWPRVVGGLLGDGWRASHDSDGNLQKEGPSNVTKTNHEKISHEPH